MKIYIGFFEGNHWAVESEREKPPSWLSKETYNWTIWEEYLKSLPRHILSPELVERLNPGDEVTKPYREQKQAHVEINVDIGSKWEDASDSEYDNEDEPYRRIILVPVEEKKSVLIIGETRTQLSEELKKVLQKDVPVKQEQEEGLIAKHLNRIKELGLYYNLVHLLERQREECLKSIMKNDFYQKHKFDFPKSAILNAKAPAELEEWKHGNPEPISKPQSQGEDELWEEVDKILAGYEIYPSRSELIKRLKKSITITHKQS